LSRVTSKAARSSLRGVCSAALLAIALGLVACGGSADDGDHDTAGQRYTTHFNDRGPLQERQRLYALYGRVSQAFREGDATAVCASFGRSINSLSYYEALGADARLAECERQVSVVMERIDSGELDWPPRKVRWIRVYLDNGMVAGVTTIPPGGSTGPSIRLQFAKEGGHWHSAFRVPDDLEAL
jgi:hypothetical protein